MNSIKIPELLSPAGNISSVKAAVNNGADAIYLGGKNFNARNSAENFTNDELLEMIDYAHLRNVKVYITINTLYKNKELKELFEFVNLMYENGADAFIVQDIGTAVFIKKHFKNIKVHGSTQMTIHNLEGVKYLENLGFDRVVLSRELSISEITYISENSNIETEIFIHGALCVSYSGLCTISSIIGQRSGNRGKCAQTCRLNFDLLKNDDKIKEGYLLSTKDIMTLPLIKEICESKVTSLKIEGRMKNPEYVTIVTKTYREQLDRVKLEDFKVRSEDVKNLTRVFSRGGSFSSGYLNTYSSEDMMSTITPKGTGIFIGRVLDYNPKTNKCQFLTTEKLTAGDGIEIFTETKPHVGTNINKNVDAGKKITVEIKGDIKKGDLVYKSYDKEMTDSLKKLYLNETKKTYINGAVKAKLNEPLKISLYYKNITVTKEGPIVSKAEKNPVSKEKLIEQLSKTGNTPFIINFENIEMDENIFLGISQINNLRREALELFENLFVNNYRRERINYSLPSLTENRNNTNPKKINVLVNSKNSFDVVVSEKIHGIYLDVHTLNNDLEYFISKSKDNGKKLFISLPTITRKDDIKTLKNNIDLLENSYIDGYLIKNFGQYELLKNTDKEIVFNSNFNVTNNLSYNFLNNLGRVCLSTELNFEEINKMPTNSEIIVYGRLLLMTLCQCPIGIYVGNKDAGRYCSERFNKDNYALKDRKDLIFKIQPNCYECNAEIYNSSVILMSDKIEDIKKSNPEYIRLEFLDEDDLMIKNIIKSYNSLGNDDIFKYTLSDSNLTHGHFYRGVF